MLFVAHPEIAPEVQDCEFAHPDDQADSGLSWRHELLKYNSQPGNNPLKLLPAWQLYENKVYTSLKIRFGIERLFILSAGWGLVPANFLLPYYDITFSPRTARYKRRGKHDLYKDFSMLPRSTEEPCVFLGGKDYVRLFCELSKDVIGPRIVFYNSLTAPEVDSCTLQLFKTRTKTNWHYECAKALVEGELEV